MQRSSSDEVELTRAVVRGAGLGARPVPPGDPERVLARVSADRRTAVGPVPGRLRRDLARPLALVAAAVAVALVVVVVWPHPRATAVTPPVLGFSLVAAEDLATAPGQPARDLLLDLAAAAEQREEPEPGTVQVVERESWLLHLEASAVAQGLAFRPTRIMSWRYPDGSVTNEERREPLRDTSGEPVAEDLLPASVSTRVIDFLGPQVAPGDALAGLPTDPDELREHLLAGSDCPADETRPWATEDQCRNFLLNQVVQLPDDQVVPGAVDAVVWRMLADEPGLLTLGETRERHGRAGVTVAARDDQEGTLIVLVVDPRDGSLLGVEWILLRDAPDEGLVAPAVTAFVAFLGSRWEPAGAGPTVDPRMVCEDHPGFTLCVLPTETET